MWLVGAVQRIYQVQCVIGMHDKRVLKESVLSTHLDDKTTRADQYCQMKICAKNSLICSKSIIFLE